MYRNAIQAGIDRLRAFYADGSTILQPGLVNVSNHQMMRNRSLLLSSSLSLSLSLSLIFSFLSLFPLSQSLSLPSPPSPSLSLVLVTLRSFLSLRPPLSFLSSRPSYSFDQSRFENRSVSSVGTLQVWFYSSPMV